MNDGNKKRKNIFFSQRGDPDHKTSQMVGKPPGAKFVLRVDFLTDFTKKFCRFLTLKAKIRTEMINLSIESSDFLFWHDKNFESKFSKFCGKHTK